MQRREKCRTSYPPKPQGHTRLPKPNFPPRRLGRGSSRGKPSGRVFDGVQLPTKVPVGIDFRISTRNGINWLRISLKHQSSERWYQIKLLSLPPFSTDPIPMPWPRNSDKAQTLRFLLGSGGNLFPTTVTRVLQPHLQARKV